MVNYLQRTDIDTCIYISFIGTLNFLQNMLGNKPNRPNVENNHGFRNLQYVVRDVMFCPYI